jgi:predicted metalloprotease
MRYGDEDRESQNVEDRRGEGGGGGFPFPMGRGGRGIQIPIGGRGGMSLTTLLIIGAIMLFFGINPLEVLLGPGGGGGGGFQDVPQMPRSDQAPRRTAERAPDIPGLPGSNGGGARVPQAEDQMKVFISKVLADTEDVWQRVFAGIGKHYKDPQLVLFSGGTRTACGVGQSAMGPFYCPLDEKVYVDLRFYDELKRRFNAPGDFAQAYVIAHEVGHHVQKQLGIAEKVEELKERSSERDANALQVMMELQADCLAGVWANLNDQVKNRLESGDIDEALNAASQIGDDMIQKRQQGYVVPYAFTHGSAAQRVRWFKRGFQSGEMQSCDTFNADSL